MSWSLLLKILEVAADEKMLDPLTPSPPEAETDL